MSDKQAELAQKGVLLMNAGVDFNSPEVLSIRSEINFIGLNLVKLSETKIFQQMFPHKGITRQ